MPELLIGSGPSLLRVVASKDILAAIQASDFTTKYIPAYHARPAEQTNSTLASLELVEGREIAFSWHPPHGKFTFPTLQQLGTRQIISLIDYCLDWVRGQKGVYNLHGSACAISREGLVLFGGTSGLGKTSLLLELCQVYDFSYIGDEKVLISEQGQLLGGVTTIEFNKPALYNLLGSRLHNHDATSSSLLSFQIEPVAATVFVQPMVVPGAKLIVEEWTATKAQWHLYEELTRKIRGVSRWASSPQYAYPCIDDRTTAQRRLAATFAIINKAKFYTIRGDLKDVGAIIRNEFTA